MIIQYYLLVRCIMKELADECQCLNPRTLNREFWFVIAFISVVSIWGEEVLGSDHRFEYHRMKDGIDGIEYYQKNIGIV